MGPLSQIPAIIAHRAKMHAKLAVADAKARALAALLAPHRAVSAAFDVDAARCEAFLRTGQGKVGRKARTLSRGTARAVREGRAAKVHDDASDTARALNWRVDARMRLAEVQRLTAEHGFDSTMPTDACNEIATLFAEAQADYF